MPDNGFTLPEARRRIEALERERDRAVTAEVFRSEQRYRDAQHLGLEKDIDELRGSQTWTFRMLIATFVGLLAEGIFLVLTTVARP